MLNQKSCTHVYLFLLTGIGAIFILFSITVAFAEERSFLPANSSQVLYLGGSSHLACMIRGDTVELVKLTGKKVTPGLAVISIDPETLLKEVTARTEQLMDTNLSSTSAPTNKSIERLIQQRIELVQAQLACSDFLTSFREQNSSSSVSASRSFGGLEAASIEGEVYPAVVRIMADAAWHAGKQAGSYVGMIERSNLMTGTPDPRVAATIDSIKRDLQELWKVTSRIYTIANRSSQFTLGDEDLFRKAKGYMNSISFSTKYDLKYYLSRSNVGIRIIGPQMQRLFQSQYAAFSSATARFSDTFTNFYLTARPVSGTAVVLVTGTSAAAIAATVGTAVVAAGALLGTGYMVGHIAVGALNALDQDDISFNEQEIRFKESLWPYQYQGFRVIFDCQGAYLVRYREGKKELGITDAFYKSAGYNRGTYCAMEDPNLNWIVDNGASGSSFVWENLVHGDIPDLPGSDFSVGITNFNPRDYCPPELCPSFPELPSPPPTPPSGPKLNLVFNASGSATASEGSQGTSASQKIIVQFEDSIILHKLNRVSVFKVSPSGTKIDYSSLVTLTQNDWNSLSLTFPDPGFPDGTSFDVNVKDTIINGDFIPSHATTFRLLYSEGTLIVTEYGQELCGDGADNDHDGLSDESPCVSLTQRLSEDCFSDLTGNMVYWDDDAHWAESGSSRVDAALCSADDIRLIDFIPGCRTALENGTIWGELCQNTLKEMRSALTQSPISLVAQPTVPGVSNGKAFAIADWNRDGKRDLVIARQDGAVLLSNGNNDGTFQNPISVISTPPVIDMAVGDNYFGVSNVISLLKPKTVSLLKRGGTSFVPVTRQLPEFGFNLQKIVSLDLNKDNYADFVATDPHPENPSLGGIFIGYGVQTGAGREPYFGSPQFISIPGAHQITAGDLNKDGRIDLVVSGNIGAMNGIHLLMRKNAPGNQWEPIRSFSTQGAFVNGETMNMAPLAITQGDFDGDKLLDIAVAGRNNNSESRIYILKNDGNGFSSLPTWLGNGTNPFLGEQLWPEAMLAEDINLDGKADLIISGDDGYSNSRGKLSVLLGTTSAGLISGSMVDVENGVRSIKIDHLNNDTLPDIVTLGNDITAFLTQHSASN